MQREVLADGLHVGHGGDPDGVPVVFVHGAMDRGAAFLRVTRLLGELDWWVYDRRGYGRSVAVEPVGIDGHVADLITLLEHVRARRGRSVAVFGHSLGGTVALAVAHRRPDLVSVVVSYESPLSWIDWWPRRGPGGPSLHEDHPEVAAERFMRRVAGDEVWEALPASTRRRRLDEGRTLVAELASVQQAAPYVPAEIVVPALVARGSETDEHRRRAAALLAREIPGSELVVLEGADHGVHTARPEAVAALVRRSLVRSGPVDDPTP